MSAFILRLIAPRPNFAQTLTESEREIMSRHAAHWRPYLEGGDMVVFGPVLTDDDSYGLAVVETDDEQAVREFAAQDPVVTTGTAIFEFGRLATGHVRERWPGIATSRRRGAVAGSGATDWLGRNATLHILIRRDIGPHVASRLAPEPGA